MKTISKTMRRGGAVSALLPIFLPVLVSALLLPGCGGNSGRSPSIPDRQFGVTEPELRDSTTNPNGTVVGRGSGMVVMRIEPPGGQAAPLLGDSAGIGVDSLWFDVDYPGTVSVDLTGEAQSVVSKVEVLRDEHDTAPLLLANAATPKASVTLATGRYLLRLTAATGATDVVQGMVWFGGTAKDVSPVDLQKVSAGNCTGCNLQRANLSGVHLHGSNLLDSDLSHALLVRVSGGFSINGTDIMAFFFGSSAVRGADLGGANLAGVRLDGAYMTGGRRSPANLHGANLSSASVADVFLAGADLAGADLQHADFSRSVLSGADLQGANPTHAVFAGADLTGANLSGGNLASTNFTGANLRGANLYGANLSFANFTGANLSGATWSNGQVCVDPSVGACL